MRRRPASHDRTPRFAKGEVVVLPFPFSDLSAAKRRPALVVAPLDGVDVILCMITSQAQRDGYAVPLNAADFARGGLPKPSYIRPNRLFTADAGLILRAAGLLTPTKLAEVVEILLAILR
jgi:mRNA interferase MazF